MSGDPHVVMVLGAGASEPFGLPIASGLKKRIIECRDIPLDKEEERHRQADWVQQRAKDLAKAFEYSGQYSIDAFLGERKDAGEIDIGRRLIAARLMPAERDAVAGPTIASDWYQWLFNQLTPDGLRALQFQGIHFVSFNYDRTLEIALATMAYNSFKLDMERAVAVMNDVPITHVYGSLAGPVELRLEENRFTVSTSNEWVLKSAAQIKIIPDHRDTHSDSALGTARRMIRNAGTVVFLGFAYNEQNLERIGIGPNVGGWHENDVTVLGSAFGLGQRERKDVATLLGHDVVLGDSEHKCERFLRENVQLKSLIAPRRNT